MSREELIEGIIMILIIIGFWPVAFLGWFPSSSAALPASAPASSTAARCATCARRPNPAAARCPLCHRTSRTRKINSRQSRGKGTSALTCAEFSQIMRRWYRWHRHPAGGQYPQMYRLEACATVLICRLHSRTGVSPVREDAPGGTGILPVILCH